MRLVVDSNIIFSAILNPNSSIGNIIIGENYQFFTPQFAEFEIVKYHSKIQLISGYSESELEDLKNAVCKKIVFVDEDFISEESWKRAFALTEHVDAKDTPFIALAIELDCKLWTGDKKLITGLEQQNFHNFIITSKL